MKLVYMLIAAFSFLFSASVFSMEIPIYGFVDQHPAQSVAVDNPMDVSSNDQIYNRDYPEILGLTNCWRNYNCRLLAVADAANTRLYWEVGWQVRNTNL